MGKILNTNDEKDLRKVLELYYRNKYPFLDLSEVDERITECQDGDESGWCLNHSFIDMIDNEIVAGAVVSELGNTIFIKYLIVDDSVRRSGFGTKIMNRIIDWSNEIGKGVVVNVGHNELKALIDFYEKFGLDVIFKGDPEDLIFRLCSDSTFEHLKQFGTTPFSQDK